MKGLYIKRGTFLTEQGFIQAFCMLFCFIGIPTLTFLSCYRHDNLYYYLNKFLQDVFSSIEASICFVFMISAPVVAFIIVIFGIIYDYYSFKKNPEGIKAISLLDEYIILHCNESTFDKILKLNEINKVYLRYKQANVFNPNAVKNGFKYGGYGIATAIGRGTASKLNYEVDISITCQNGKIFTMTIPAKFSNKPYSQFEKVEDYFKKVHVYVCSNLI